MDFETRRLIVTTPLVVVDFDGTLATLALDWVGLKARLATEARAFGLPWTLAWGLDANLRHLRSLDGFAFRWFCGLVAEAEREAFAPETVHADLVDALRERGSQPVAVFTANTHAAIAHILGTPDFRGLSPHLIAKEDVTHGKPDPEGVMLACRHFGLAPEEGLFIGNATSDQLAAEAVGMPFLHIDQLEETPCTMPPIHP